MRVHGYFQIEIGAQAKHGGPSQNSFVIVDEPWCVTALATFSSSATLDPTIADPHEWD
jgi:hypothetical protein